MGGRANSFHAQEGLHLRSGYHPADPISGLSTLRRIFPVALSW